MLDIKTVANDPVNSIIAPTVPPNLKEYLFDITLRIIPKKDIKNYKHQNNENSFDILKVTFDKNGVDNKT